ncbi:MAG: RluA family pseudouridine synthase [Clostridiales bacterium]|jgi:23S rRNA pseudouridine1911/1915/1917 synthase|nr:RluA family pseudouridine synthase [Clostridiales bacterium]
MGFFVVEPCGEGERLDVYLARNIDSLSRNAIQRLIGVQAVTVNNLPAKASLKIHAGDGILISIPEPRVLEAVPEPIPLDIVYEDAELCVVNKPRGMVVHPAAGHFSGTLVNALLYHCAGRLSGINGVLRPGIVHRIDKDTSGLLVAAKTDVAHVKLSRQLENHSMTRVYHAIVYNRVAGNNGTIDKPLGRSPSDRKKIAVVSGGKPAVTHYSVLERFGKFTWIEAALETGRTHQIRVHMASEGHPLLGDEVYGPSGAAALGFAGQVLHAKTLGFVHPGSGEYIYFDSGLPEYFLRAVEFCRTAG